MNMGRTWQRAKCRATAPFLKCKYALQQNLQNRTVEDGREDQAGPCGKSDRPMVPPKPGNSGGGTGPWLKGRRKKQ